MMQNWFTRAYGRWSDTAETRREAARLAAMPHYLLRDMGLSLEGRTALARQLRAGGR
jgi:hypothetical protein